MAYKVIRVNRSRAMRCIITWNGDEGYQVAEGEYGHVVHLGNRTCTCRAWMLNGIPCAHAIAALHDKGLDPLNYVERWYQKDVYVQAYSDFIQPVPNLKMIPEGSKTPVEQPPVKPLPGRPRRNRRKAKDEVKKCGKLSKAGTKVSCSYCKGYNHNKKDCKKRKAYEEAQQTGMNVLASSVTANPRNAPHSSNLHKPAQTSKRKEEESQSASQAITKRAKLLVKRTFASNISRGQGVFISERTGWTCMQSGNPENDVVIRTSSAQLKSSAVVTGDLGFQPTSRKWKGKSAMTQADLVSSGAKKQSQIRIRARNLKETASQSTEAQRMRAAANKAAAEARLAARGKSASQPNPSHQWKY